VKTDQVIDLLDKILIVCSGQHGSVTIVALLEALAHVMAKTVSPTISTDTIIAESMDQLREAITDLREQVESAEDTEESVH
jgi:selenophosphate synthetase-related protein